MPQISVSCFCALYERNHTICVLLRLASFVQQNICESLNVDATLHSTPCILSTTDVHLGCFQSSVLVDTAVVNILVLAFCGTDT